MKGLKTEHSKSTRNVQLSVNVQPVAQILLTYHVTHSMWTAVLPRSYTEPRYKGTVLPRHHIT